MSTSPTPTSSQTATSTPGFSSIFQSPGGPPLILVCIAAALLLGAFCGVLLMRRMRPRVVVQRMTAADFLRGLNSKLGEKPTLLDIHLLPSSEGTSHEEAGGNGKGKDLVWAHLSPFAVLYLPSTQEESTSSSPAPSTAPSFSPGRGIFSRILTQFYWANPSWRPRAREHNSGNPRVQPEVRRVQLAVVISMPSPHRPTHPSITLSPLPSHAGASRASMSHNPLDENAHAGHDHDDVTNPVPDCCIGTAAVSYKPDPDAITAAATPANTT